jgi:hypothetical protein
MIGEYLLQVVEGFVPFIPAAAVEIESFFVWLDAELDRAVSDVFIPLRECTSAGALAFAAPFFGPDEIGVLSHDLFFEMKDVSPRRHRDAEVLFKTTPRLCASAVKICIISSLRLSFY